MLQQYGTGAMTGGGNGGHKPGRSGADNGSVINFFCHLVMLLRDCKLTGCSRIFIRFSIRKSGKHRYVIITLFYVNCNMVSQSRHWRMCIMPYYTIS